MKHSLVFFAGLVLFANPALGDEGSDPDEVEIVIAVDWLDDERKFEVYDGDG